MFDDNDAAFPERHGVGVVRDGVVADRAPGHAAHRHVVRPLQLQPARLLLRRRNDLQQGEVHLIGILVQPGEQGNHPVARPCHAL